MTQKAVEFTTRLTPAVYRDLESKLLHTIPVTKETTEIQAGYMLGIQTVLKVLRDGFTVSEG